MNRKILRIIIIAVIILIVGGAAVTLFISRYGLGKITVEQQEAIDYEWRNIASEYGITGDYLWSRIKELMLNKGEDGVLIPSAYMIEGRLTTQPKEESGVYLLSDQALLMDMYVRQSDRLAARTLKNTVMSRFDMEGESHGELATWLKSYIGYYVRYGNGDDYNNIVEIVSFIFDEDGKMLPEELSSASYEEGGFYSTVDIDEESGDSTLDSLAGEADDLINSYRGVEIKSIDLELIRILEDNDLLPEGSYDRDLDIVNGAVVSNELPLYAYAYTEADGEINYIYSHEHAASVNVADSITVMRHLAEVGELQDRGYMWIKSAVMNAGTLYDTYYYVTGGLDGNEAVDSYTDIMTIAYLKDDTDLYKTICSYLGARVATYNNSPALSMIYRTNADRYYFQARENLSTCLSIM